VVGKRKIPAFCVALWAASALAAAPVSPLRIETLAPGLRASFSPDFEIDIAVSSHPGDAWTRLAKRVTGDAANWKAIADINGMGEKLTTEKPVLVPFALAKPELKRQSMEALFPADRVTPRGWVHRIVGGSGIEGESLWNLAAWFTGDGANYRLIRSANGDRSLSTRRGEDVLIPDKLLSPPFQAPAALRNTSAEKTKAVEDDPSDAAQPPEPEAREQQHPVAPGPVKLDYVVDGAEPHAVYHLQKGEALYSAVAIRFTGRVYSKDVRDVIEKIVQFNGIADVAKLPVGYAVRIPLELLVPEYRPANDPRRLAAEKSRRESARLARRVEARNLEGVTVILDAGHGGRDVGTTHDGIRESDYVYDVMCRLKRELEKKTKAKVWSTTRSKFGGYAFSDDDEIVRRTDHVVLTSPQYPLDNPVVGVHLRWYLANSIFRRALARSIAAEKVVFLSIHADSLHPSLRGLMAYVPGQRYVQGTYRKNGDVYLARSEVRESPSVTQSEEDALRAEGLSTDLAEAIVDSFQERGLNVHAYDPIRDNVVRDGREWVPAVIRYNKVPTRLLLEICNLGNPSDRKLIRTFQYRQELALAIRKGIVSYFEQQAGEAPGPELAAASR
jgi:N-acetylmuramoyl-L-alanine amidase